jgi:rhodanese-related sulfurtransferase
MRELSQNFTSLNIDETKKMLKNNTPIIDIRRANEWANSGIIDNAKTIAFFTMFGTYKLEKWLEEFKKTVKNKNDKFILVCASANRTKALANILQNEGYTNIYELDCGMSGWIRNGNEVVAYSS